MKNLKIAVFTDSFLPVRGGTELATYNLCKSLIELGNEVILFAPDYHREQTFTEFPVHRVKSLSLSKSDKMVFSFCDFNRIFKIVKEFAPDIIYYCTANGMARMALRAAKKLNIPCIATMHTKFKDAFYDSCHSKIITKMLLNSLVKKLNRTDEIVCVSNDLGLQLKGEGFKKDYKIIKNGVDYFDKTAPKLQDKEQSDVFNLFFVGHVIKVKNIQFSLRSLAYLKNTKNFSNFKFSIVGSGKYEKTLKKLTKKLNLQNNVEFLGYIGDKNILAKHYSQSHLFLLPSTFDNDALVILEAAQVGTPSVVIKGTGSSERITDNQNGFLSNYTIEEYGDRIYEVLHNKELYNKVCENINTIFGESWKQVALKYQTLFNELIDKKNSK
ncbi:MAG: glycosyltransferase family 4 protein [Clostridiales bacterium]|nr:glycosyltransferase family 4 protein [Clostridiales bacterium]